MFLQTLHTNAVPLNWTKLDKDRHNVRSPATVDALKKGKNERERKKMETEKKQLRFNPKQFST